jgi:hypothetical protein
MDTTRPDVFALDPVTLRWVQAELTVGMDWHTRCITGIRLTPVPTKAADAAAARYQAYGPGLRARTGSPRRARWSRCRKEAMTTTVTWRLGAPDADFYADALEDV